MTLEPLQDEHENELLFVRRIPEFTVHIQIRSADGNIQEFSPSVTQMRKIAEFLTEKTEFAEGMANASSGK